MLAKMALAKGHSSKTKSQVSDIKPIGPLDFLSFCLFVCLLIYKYNIAERVIARIFTLRKLSTEAMPRSIIIFKG